MLRRHQKRVQPAAPLSGRSDGSAYERIWRAVAALPRGRVATYGQVARLAGLPRQARLVGYALHRAPETLKLPWHRVVNARGAISLPPSSPAHAEQRRRLLAEGVLLAGGRVDLARFGLPA